MIKNVEKAKHKDEKKNSPYTRLIKFFKEIISKFPDENSEKYTSVTNRASLLTSKKNALVINQDEKNKFQKIEKNDKNEININKNIEIKINSNNSNNLINNELQKKYEPNLYSLI